MKTRRAAKTRGSLSERDRDGGCNDETWRQEKPQVSAAVENAAGGAATDRGRPRGDAQEGCEARKTFRNRIRFLLYI